MNGVATVVFVQITCSSWKSRVKATPQLPDINGALGNVHTGVKVE